MSNGIKFLNIESEEQDIPWNFEDHFGLHFFRPQYVWFLLYLFVAFIPNSSGQLAELIIPPE